ncbi:MAG: hypothetical protein HON94_08945 [Methylococcales bacterium]|jgi:hypothetical protein|nr:hypothetical protein [Methylococcales bacterium]MBT7409075.1 hypothetical protein [Methylococcales bacterium]
MNPENSEFLKQFRGCFTGILRWPQFDELLETLRSEQQNWYIYAIGETPPETSSDWESTLNFITEINDLIKKEHDESYCGVVYVDDKSSPTMVKIFDPNNLGVSCGFSDNPPLPGWIMSLKKPDNLSEILQPAKRRRWWSNIFKKS